MGHCPTCFERKMPMLRVIFVFAGVALLPVSVFADATERNLRYKNTYRRRERNKNKDNKGPDNESIKCGPLSLKKNKIDKMQDLGCAESTDGVGAWLIKNNCNQLSLFDGRGAFIYRVHYLPVFHSLLNGCDKDGENIFAYKVGNVAKGMVCMAIQTRGTEVFVASAQNQKEIDALAPFANLNCAGWENIFHPDRSKGYGCMGSWDPELVLKKFKNTDCITVNVYDNYFHNGYYNMGPMRKQHNEIMPAQNMVDQGLHFDDKLTMTVVNLERQTGKACTAIVTNDKNVVLIGAANPVTNRKCGEWKNILTQNYGCYKNIAVALKTLRKNTCGTLTVYDDHHDPNHSHSHYYSEHNKIQATMAPTDKVWPRYQRKGWKADPATQTFVDNNSRGGGPCIAISALDGSVFVAIAQEQPVVDNWPTK